MCVHARLLAEESFSRAPRGEDSFSLAGKVGARLAKPERSDQKGVQKKNKTKQNKKRQHVRTSREGIRKSATAVRLAEDARRRPQVGPSRVSSRTLLPAGVLHPERVVTDVTPAVVVVDRPL